jgi:hypothetical protein
MAKRDPNMFWGVALWGESPYWINKSKKKLIEMVHYSNAEDRRRLSGLSCSMGNTSKYLVRVRVVETMKRRLIKGGDLFGRD